MVMPPMQLRASGARVEDPAGGEHAEQARHAHLAGVDVDPHLGELGAERVPRERRVGLDLGLVSARASSPPRGDAARVRRRERCAAARHAFTTAEPHDAVPIEPPATARAGSVVSPISTRTTLDRRRPARRRRSGSSTVRAPVPMSAAPSLHDVAPVGLGARRGLGRPAGGPDTSTQPRPCPTSQRAVARAPGRRVARSAQPKRSAPSRRHSTRPRLENGRPVSGSTSGSLRIRSSIGSIPHGDRELVHRGLERVHARALARGAHPGRRRHVERAPARWRRPAVGRRVHHPRGEAVCSANSPTVEVCSTTSWRDRRQPAVLAGSEPKALDRRRAVADEGEHLLARDRHLDRAPRRLARPSPPESRAGAACPSSRTRRRRAARSRGRAPASSPKASATAVAHRRARPGWSRRA